MWCAGFGVYGMPIQNVFQNQTTLIHPCALHSDYPVCVLAWRAHKQILNSKC